MALTGRVRLQFTSTYHLQGKVHGPVMVPYIPLELVDLIASFALALGDDTGPSARYWRSRLAGSLSLVCRAWHRLGQGYLWRHLKLYDGQPSLDSLTNRERLLGTVQELILVSIDGSREMRRSVALCGRECRRLRKVILIGSGAWSAWASIGVSATVSRTVVDISFVRILHDRDWASALGKILSSSCMTPRATRFTLNLESAPLGGAFPALGASAVWPAVTDVVIHAQDSHTVGVVQPLLQAVPGLFLLDRLTSLDLKVADNLTAILSLLHHTTSLSHLSLGIDKRDMSRFARQLSPILAAMTSLETLALRYHTGTTRVGGLRALPPSLLVDLPFTLRTVDLDLGVTGPTLDAVQAFLAQRVDEALEQWTTSATAATHVRAGHEEHAPVVWVKVGREWVQQ
ncbi:hypothetical protein JCM8208_006313 [Rhodotorula glutinis]